MTKEFREGDFSSHKSLIGLPEAHATPMHQENSLVHLENFGTINFSKTHLLLDQISPEHTGTPKEPLARPPGSLEVKNFKTKRNTRKEKNQTFIRSKHKIKQREALKKEEISTKSNYYEEIIKIEETLEGDDEQYTAKNSVIEINSIVIEIPQEVGSEVIKSSSVQLGGLVTSLISCFSLVF
jgi:hypothetical protein